MDREFWLNAWQTGRTAFHQSEVHADLVAYAPRWLAGGPHRVLVPLCGKTLDLDWLAGEGHEVVGVELAFEAIMAVMNRRTNDPDLDKVGPFVRHGAGRLAVFQGDWFEATPALLGTFDRVWDRAALVAMSPEQRAAYVAVTRSLLRPGGSVLLSTFSYDQARMAGPPFSVPDEAVVALYDGMTAEKLRGEDQDPGRFRDRGLDAVSTSTWLLAAERP